MQINHQFDTKTKTLTFTDVNDNEIVNESGTSGYFSDVPIPYQLLRLQ